MQAKRLVNSGIQIRRILYISTFVWGARGKDWFELFSQFGNMMGFETEVIEEIGESCGCGIATGYNCETGVAMQPTGELSKLSDCAIRQMDWMCKPGVSMDWIWIILFGVD